MKKRVKRKFNIKKVVRYSHSRPIQIIITNNEEVDIPEYNFILGEKEYHNNPIKLGNKAIILMEGLHCINDEMTNQIDNSLKYKIYLSPFTPLNVDKHNYVSTVDLRLIRRMVRDKQFRGYKAIHTLQRWDSVVRGEEKYIFPFQEEADSMFNSSLIYELAVLKDFALPLLEEINNNSIEFSEAKRLYKMLSYFESIPVEYLPSNSLIREFVGGSIFEE